MIEIIIKKHDSGQLEPVEELVRCKYCEKHGKPECPVQILFPNDGISHTDDDWYCADGEQKDGDGE